MGKFYKEIVVKIAKMSGYNPDVILQVPIGDDKALEEQLKPKDEVIKSQVGGRTL